MTNSDLKTNEAIQSINRKLKNQHEIDWEQRRYEIAKDVLAYCCLTSKELFLAGGKLDNDGDTFAEKVANQAVMFADALVKRLKSKE